MHNCINSQTVKDSLYYPIQLTMTSVEHCTGVAEVMGLNPVEACIYNCDHDQTCLHFFLCSSNI